MEGLKLRIPPRGIATSRHERSEIATANAQLFLVRLSNGINADSMKLNRTGEIQDGDRKSEATASEFQRIKQAKKSRMSTRANECASTLL